MKYIEKFNFFKKKKKEHDPQDFILKRHLSKIDLSFCLNYKDQDQDSHISKNIIDRGGFGTLNDKVDEDEIFNNLDNFEFFRKGKLTKDNKKDMNLDTTISYIDDREELRNSIENVEGKEFKEKSAEFIDSKLRSNIKIIKDIFDRIIFITDQAENKMNIRATPFGYNIIFNYLNTNTYNKIIKYLNSLPN